MKRKGQIQISFGMIFSIIIVIATIAIGFYVINYFLDLSNCTKVGLFRDSLNNKINGANGAWYADIVEDEFKGNVPSKINYVCFGNFSMTPEDSTKTKEIFEELKKYGEEDKNVFIYPPKEACEGAFYNLKHVSFEENKFFCVEAKSGTITLAISKTSGEPLVKLSKL